jgi:hypothetical protein
MSDDLERRLREAGRRLSGPTDVETGIARSRVIAPRARRPHRVVLLLGAALALAGAFGVGYAVAASAKSPPRPIVRHVAARLDAGPGFLPSSDWHTVALGTLLHASATATNTPASGLGPHGVRISARFQPAAAERAPQRLLPLQLPAGGKVRHLRAHVGPYAVDVTVTFGAAHPSASALVAAREELGRLVVPSCPVAQPISAADVASAKAHVLRRLPTHYSGNPSDVVGATATARAGAAMPRHGEAAADCGARVASRSVEVDVTLPRVAKVSASLSQLTYFAARTAQGWTVWERAR